MDQLNNFSIDLASKYGLEQAVMMQFLTKALWSENAFNRKIIDGITWVYLPLPDVEFYLTFWTEAHISRILTSLVYHGVVAKKNIPELGRGFSYSFKA